MHINTLCISRPFRRLLHFIVLLLLPCGVATAQVTSSVPGTGTGAIPDGPGPGCGIFGSELLVSFEMPDLIGIQDIQVDITMTHTWMGDVEATLRAPDGDSHVLFSRTGSTTSTGCGRSSDLNSTYVFSDLLPTSDNWWSVAAINPVPAGNYRSTTPGGGAGGGVDTVITDSFDNSYPAGTWQLAFRDNGNNDTGAVSSATLSVMHAGCRSLPCIFTSPPNNENNGVFFDITAKSDAITVTGVDFVPTSNGPFQLLYKNGTYVGFDMNPAPWEQDQPIRQISGANGTDLQFYKVNNVRIPANQTKGFLLGGDDSGADSPNLRYTGSSGFVGTFENEHLTLFSDLGGGSVGGPVIDMLSSGGRNTPRQFAGIIYYEVDDASCYVTVATNGNLVTFCL